MNPVDLAKLVLAIGVTLSIVGISFQLMRLLGAVTDNIRDLRPTIKKVTEIVDEFAQDQKLLKEGISAFVGAGKSIKGMIGEIREKVMTPVNVISKFLLSIAAIATAINKKFHKD